MSWLKDFYKKKPEITEDILCIVCRKPVEKWLKDTGLICGHCQMLQWQRSQDQEEREEQEHIERIAEALVRKLREDYELANRLCGQ